MAVILGVPHEMISELIPVSHELERSIVEPAPKPKGKLMSPLAVLLWSSGRKSANTDTPDLIDQISGGIMS